jgi:hypothetical protein
MKKMISFITAVFIISIMTGGCSQCTSVQEMIAPKDKAEEKVVEPQGDAVPAEKIAKEIGGAICVRAIECNPGQKITQEQCAGETMAALEALIAGKKISLSPDEFEGCLKSIKTGTCKDVLQSEAPPKGCEMLR